ncbi:hypothetical protein F4604DRAFT_1899932 [Suillus subluteus]|nr:hypothetical protein F4604DRAFT_1899932 [Suillus subluteus]
MANQAVKAAESSDNEQVAPPGFPDCWKVPKNRVLALLFHALCLISMTRPTLIHYWQINGDIEWKEHKKTVVGKLKNSVWLGNALSNQNTTKYNTTLQVLAVSAVFLSTQPPLTSFLPYTKRVCYILTLVSFAHALGGLMCGLAVANVYQECEQEWIKRVMTCTRFRLCCSLLLISWPSVSLALSILLLMLALVIAAYTSGIWWFQFMAAIMKETESIQSDVKHVAGCWASYRGKPPVAFEHT